MRATFYLENYFKNLPFDVDNELINRDNYAYSHYLLKKFFYEKGVDLSTYDINTIEESEIVIYNDMPKILPNKKNIKNIKFNRY